MGDINSANGDNLRNSTFLEADGTEERDS